MIPNIWKNKSHVPVTTNLMVRWSAPPLRVSPAAEDREVRLVPREAPGVAPRFEWRKWWENMGFECYFLGVSVSGLTLIQQKLKTWTDNWKIEGARQWYWDFLTETCSTCDFDAVSRKIITEIQLVWFQSCSWGSLALQLYINHHLPSGHLLQFAIANSHRKFVSFPIQNGGSFHSSVNVYYRVCHSHL